MDLSNKQYTLLLDLYHALPEAFHALPGHIKDAFNTKLQARQHARMQLAQQPMEQKLQALAAHYRRT